MGRIIAYIDFTILGIIVALLSCSIFVLSSMKASIATEQILFAAVAILVFFVSIHIDRVIYLWASPFLYVVSIVMLSLSYFGPSIRGAHRWLQIGTIQIQPSEFVKPFLLLFFAAFMAKFPPKNVRNILIHLSIFIVPSILVFRQPDLGSTIIYISAWLAMMVASGFPLRILLVIGLSCLLLLPASWNVLHDFQRDRIITFINPGHDPLGVGYNAIQAMIAVGSGQFFGRGLGRGTQSHLQFLPEFHTDFIFATCIEELGFVGGFIILFLYFMLLFRMLRPLVTGAYKEPIGFIFTLGLATMLLFQVFINIGMNMGIAPITGITLPFLSAGGSSLVSLLISFGIYMVLKQNPKNISN